LRTVWVTLGNWHDREGNSNVEEDLLTRYLKKQSCTDSDIQKSVNALKHEANSVANRLYQANLTVYGLLRYGINIQSEAGENKKNIHPIDWAHPRQNDFYIAEEVTIRGANTKRPDLVVYINGIAVAVIELKRSTVAVRNGIRQNVDKQKDLFIQPFFTTNQLIFAGNASEGLFYGVIETPEKFWLRWKESNPDEPNELDRSIFQLFDKERLLELVHDFIIFDAGKKKTCRPNQYFGVKAAQPRVLKKKAVLYGTRKVRAKALQWFGLLNGFTKISTMRGW